jgi:hypothetical protein
MVHSRPVLRSLIERRESGKGVLGVKNGFLRTVVFMALAVLAVTPFASRAQEAGPRIVSHFESFAFPIERI